MSQDISKESQFEIGLNGGLNLEPVRWVAQVLSQESQNFVSVNHA